MFKQVESMLCEILNLRQNASKISATIADNAALIRSLIVQAEDSRILAHMYVLCCKIHSLMFWISLTIRLYQH